MSGQRSLVAAALLAVVVGAATASPQSSAPRPAATGVFINEREVSQAQLRALQALYGAAPPAGRYWYDARSGLYGYWGREAWGYIRPGHDFGALSSRASNGNTGVFLNGREINLAEAAFFQRIFGVVYRGNFWLDGRTGYVGVVGNPMPIANLVEAIRRSGATNSSEYHWRDGSGAVISSSGNCTFASIPGAPVYSTPGCG